MRLLRFLALAGFIAVPLGAAAQSAYTTTAVNMRAGPDPTYPLVTRLAPGTPLTVGGCLQSYTWCDVYTGNVRGWVYASYLTYPYQSGAVPIYSYGPALGLPIITFSIGSYWDNYYRGRPFYGNRNYWYNHPYHAPGPRFAHDWHAPPPPRGPSHYYPQQAHDNHGHDGGNYRRRPTPAIIRRPTRATGHRHRAIPKGRARTARIVRPRARATTPPAAKRAADTPSADTEHECNGAPRKARRFAAQSNCGPEAVAATARAGTTTSTGRRRTAPGARPAPRRRR